MDDTVARLRSASPPERDAILERVLVDTRLEGRRAASTLNALTDLLEQLHAFEAENRA